MSKSLQRLEFAVPMGSLDSYFHWANQVPMLTAEEEHDLAVNYHENGDLDAAKRLVMSHLRYVISTARGYAGYGLPQGDLIQEGNIGLMKAVKRFDPSRGVRLVSYAVHWIKAEIHEYILRNWRIVKIATTKAQRKLFFNLRKSTQQVIGWMKDKDVTELATNLDVKEETVRQMEASMHAHDPSFDCAQDEDSDWSAPAHYLVDNRFDPARTLEASDWADQRQKALHEALASLDPRSQEILHARWLTEHKATLHDLASKYGVSAERIRQLEANAMKKVKVVLEEAA